MSCIEITIASSGMRPMRLACAFRSNDKKRYNNVTTNQPERAYRTALDWALELINGTDPAQVNMPTPCTEWNVDTLIGHIIATIERATVIGRGEPPFSVPSIVTGLAPSQWADRFEAATQALWEVWNTEERLLQMVEVPWGRVTGADALAAYAQETIAHCWDLAQATGQPSDGPDDVVFMLLEVVEHSIPAEPRGGHLPFGPVMTPPPGSTPTERLVSWIGRDIAWK